MNTVIIIGYVGIVLAVGALIILWQAHRVSRQRRFANFHRCVECRERLSRSQVYYSDGRCPKCGHKAPSTGTVVATTEHAESI